jgi:hypothetical protein
VQYTREKYGIAPTILPMRTYKRLTKKQIQKIHALKAKGYEPRQAVKLLKINLPAMRYYWYPKVKQYVLKYSKDHYIPYKELTLEEKAKRSAHRRKVYHLRGKAKQKRYKKRYVAKLRIIKQERNKLLVIEIGKKLGLYENHR